MTSIWGFLFQTIEVSLVAIILLIIKRLFQDKLSPRWQYGIWSLLVIGIIVPTGYFGGYILPIINVYIETFKTMIEKGLHSQYISSYEVIHNFMGVPLINKFPSSITDMIFVIYVIGIGICLVRYLIHYWSLKMIINKGQCPSDEITQQIKRVAKQYQLNSCCTVIIENIPSAFVFGILKPVLVLPQHHVNDKIILHELLHLKYKDVLQNMLWSLLKCIHWCNPFLNYVFQIIHNDMESLCDQRVLELVEGEERREYGRILLSMTNDKYPSAFGTSSISNGGKNIKKRIEAIARFKLYPKGMFLVSICIGVLLLPMILTGINSKAYIEKITDDPESFDYQLSVSSAKMIRCETMTSAIDLYAKGILKSNDLYLISVMPKSQQQNYLQILKDKPTDIYSNGQESLYKIINLEKVNNQLYKAYLLFEQVQEEYSEDEEDNEYYLKYFIIPIEITHEQGWKVQQVEDIVQGKMDGTLSVIHQDTSHLPVYKHYTQEIKTGKIDLNIYNIQTMTNQTNSYETYDIFGLGVSSFSLEPDFYAKIDQSYQLVDCTYTNQQSGVDINWVGTNMNELYDLNEDVLEEELGKDGYQSQSGEGNGVAYSYKPVNDEWNRQYQLNSYVYGETKGFISSHLEFPKGYQISIWLNKEKVDTVRMEVDGEMYE